MNKNLEGIKKVCQRMVGECADFIVGTYTLQVRNNDLMVRTKSGYMQVAQLSENIQNEILHKCSTGTKSNTKRNYTEAEKKNQMILRKKHSYALAGISKHYKKDAVIAPIKSRHNFIYNGDLCKVLVRSYFHRENFSISDGDFKLIDIMYFVFDTQVPGKKIIKTVNLANLKKSELKKMAKGYYLISNEQINKYCVETFEINSK